MAAGGRPIAGPGRACARLAVPGRTAAARHGGAARLARPAPPARALLRRALPAASPAARAVPQNPPQQSARLRHRRRLRHGEAAAGAEGGGGPERGRAERPGRAAGAAGPGGDGGLRLRPRLPLQRLGGSSLSPPADTDHRLPHPALWGAHRPRAAVRGGLWGAAGRSPLPPCPPRPRHSPAGGKSAHHHPQPAAAGGHQLPSGPHRAALGGLHHSPAGGGPGPGLHIPPGDRGRAAGPDVRRLGRLQRAPAGPAALLQGGLCPPPQGGLRSPTPPWGPPSSLSRAPPWHMTGAWGSPAFPPLPDQGGERGWDPPGPPTIKGQPPPSPPAPHRLVLC